MTQKKPIQISSRAKTATSKELAAQLAGKKPGEKLQAWTQTFAASGAKVGGKVNVAAD